VGNNIGFDLIDFDQSAIDFSMKKNEKFAGQISFNRINALRFNSYKLYDLIWSAGLFDYFKDKHFTFLIRKYINCLTEDGEMVISNFCTKNPTKRLMEVISDWYLNLRTESDLYRISSDANIDKEMVSVEKEPLGINLFLKIRKN
jgi:extracellular factor (EF) 3-hydroxypalmitic acid methyl ester biosynthesis protein